MALVRHPQKSNQKNVEERAFDLEQDVNVSTLKGVDFLVHAAYVKYDRKQPEAMRINLEGTKRLMAASKANGVKKNIFMSSMSAHNEAVSTYGIQKLAIEKLFTGKESVVLRSGLIVGNGGIVKQMVDFIRSKHVVPLIGGGTQPLQIIAVQDLARIIETCIERDLDGRFVTATPQVYTYKEFYQAIGKRLNTRILFVPVPFGVLQAILKIVSILHLPVGINEDNLQGLKMLRSSNTASDLKKIGVTVDSLEVALEKTQLDK